MSQDSCPYDVNEELELALQSTLPARQVLGGTSSVKISVPFHAPG